MKKFIYINVDTNDGDYIGELSSINDSEIELLKSIISKMPKDEDSIRYEVGDCGDDDNKEGDYDYITQEEKDFLNRFTPSCEYGFHTIQEVSIVSEIETLL